MYICIYITLWKKLLDIFYVQFFSLSVCVCVCTYMYLSRRTYVYEDTRNTVIYIYVFTRLCKHEPISEGYIHHKLIVSTEVAECTFINMYVSVKWRDSKRGQLREAQSAFSIFTASLNNKLSSCKENAVFAFLTRNVFLFITNVPDSTRRPQLDVQTWVFYLFSKESQRCGHFSIFTLFIYLNQIRVFINIYKMYSHFTSWKLSLSYSRKKVLFGK